MRFFPGTAARRIFLVFTVICAIPLAWFGTPIVRDQFAQPIRYIDVEGSLEMSERALIEGRLAGVDRRHPDIARIKRDLERLGWVDRVSVRSVWPDGLRIRITRHRAIARWGEQAYLSETGRVFTLPNPAQEKLATLNGPEGSAREVMAQYQQLSKAFQPAGQVVTEVSLGDRGEWLVRLKSGVSVRLGKEDISDRLMRLIRVMEDSNLLSRMADIAQIDARYTNGVAVKWKEGHCEDNCSQLADNENGKRVQAYERHGG